MTRRTGYFLISMFLFAAAIYLLAVLLAEAAPAAGGNPPLSIYVAAPLTGVNCAGPCCCGDLWAVYRGHRYGRASFCRWFRPLREGQIVTTTLTLAW
jgi:hypothetical protein